MRTYRLFWDDCYQRDFTAEVLEVCDQGIILDKTCFYPQGGGQPGDTGYIDDIRIVDTQKVGDAIIHLFEGSHLAPAGSKVHGRIDWNRRYKLMRIHSASHIMEYFLFRHYGQLELVSAFISENRDRSTYATNINITNDTLSIVEAAANNFIEGEHPIILYPSEEEPSLRYWECGPIKYPCGGTHPKNTKEIGPLCLKRKSGGSGKHMIITTLED